MSKELRYNYILKYLEENDYISSEEIIKKFNITAMTARRDLTYLESKSFLIRNHGGALKTSVTENAFTFSSKIKKNTTKKKELCSLAGQFINDNEIIFVDCGSTLFYLCPYIKKKKNLRVITNSLPVLTELVNFPNIIIHFIGGEVNSKRKATYGKHTEKHIAGLYADKAFVGADGLSIEKGLSSFDAQEGAVTSSMIKNSKKTYLLCDASKLESNSYSHTCDIKKIDYLITNKKIKPEILKKYKKIKTLRLIR